MATTASATSTSMLKLQGQLAAGGAELTDRVLAHFVAENRVAAMRLAGAWSRDTAMQSGEEEQAGRRFRWRLERFSTPDPGVVRVEVTVTDADGRRLADLTSFLEVD